MRTNHVTVKKEETHVWKAMPGVRSVQLCGKAAAALPHIAVASCWLSQTYPRPQLRLFLSKETVAKFLKAWPLPIETSTQGETRNRLALVYQISQRPQFLALRIDSQQPVPTFNLSKSPSCHMHLGFEPSSSFQVLRPATA